MGEVSNEILLLEEQITKLRWNKTQTMGNLIESHEELDEEIEEAELMWEEFFERQEAIERDIESVKEEITAVLRKH